VIVEPPEDCPPRTASLIAELDSMENDGRYPATRRFIIDDLEPFCIGLEAM